MFYVVFVHLFLLNSCIHLLAELSQQKPVANKVSSMLPVLAEATRHRHYRQHLSLLETLLHRLPHIAKGLGKTQFKRHLELFLDSVFYGAVSSQQALTCTGTCTPEMYMYTIYIYIYSKWYCGCMIQKNTPFSRSVTVH